MLRIKGQPPKVEAFNIPAIGRLVRAAAPFKNGHNADLRDILGLEKK